jgi:energy-coupling factor transporter ATP-binding protein EcfA2
MTLDPARACALIPSTTGKTISVDNVSFSYSHRSPLILENIRLTLEPGTVYFLLGPNGSGKTTFVKLLSGTLLPREGSIYYGSDQFEPAKSSNRFAGLAFQNPDFQWTSQTIGGEFKKMQKGANVLPGLEGVLPTFGVPPTLVNADPNAVSFALKKRLGIALAVLFGKSWLIFDEPTLGQDREFRLGLAEFIRRALGRGVGIILISHDTAFRTFLPDAKKLFVGNQKIVLADK